MDPAQLLAAPDAIPAAPWFFRGLLDVTFSAHLLLMNAMLGLTLLGLARSLLTPAGAHRPYGLGRQAGLVPSLTALAVNVGVAPLLFLQALYGQFLYVSSLLMGVYWFAVVLAAMAAYGLGYRQKYLLHDTPGRGVWLWALMSLFMLYVSLAQTHNAVLAIRPDLWAGYWENPQGTLLAWGDPTLLPRWLHFVVASVALGGLTLAMIGHGRAKRHDPHGPDLEREGLRWFAWATVVQVPGGMWWLMALPKPVMLAFMGRDPVATGLLVAGLAGAVASLVLAFRGKLMPTAMAAACTVAAMTIQRGMLRQLYLDPYFNPETLPVRPEPTTVAMFLGCVALAVAVVIWAARHPKVDRSPAMKA